MTDTLAELQAAQQARRDARERQMDDYDRRHPPQHPPLEKAATGRMGSRRIGAIHELTIGCLIWARHEGPDRRLNHRGEPQGGIVLEIIDITHTDNDTGEITRARAFRYVDPYDRIEAAFGVLAETSVNPDACETCPPALLGRTFRRLAALAATGPATIADRDWRTAQDMAHLAAILNGAAA